ncbi:MAG: hypothetical protein ACREH6_10690 [Geminicoccaceae bacterium]
MAQPTPRAHRACTPLGASAAERVVVVAGALLLLWSAIGWVLGWWG